MYIYSNIYVKFLEISGVYHFSIITGKFSLLHDEDDGGDEHDEFEDDGVGVVVWWLRWLCVAGGVDVVGGGRGGLLRQKNRHKFFKGKNGVQVP